MTRTDPLTAAPDAAAGVTSGFGVGVGVELPAFEDFACFDGLLGMPVAFFAMVVDDETRLNGVLFIIMSGSAAKHASQPCQPHSLITPE